MKFYKVKLQMTKDKTVEYDPIIANPMDIVQFINKIEQYDLSINERVIVIALNTKNHVVAYTEISSGGMNTCNVNIPDIYRFLFTTNANKFILVHNHPSGDSTPSKIDIAMTKQIQQSADLMQVEFLDHIIIGDNNYTSIFEYIEKEVK